MSITEPTYHSLVGREIAVQSFSEAVLPYLQGHHPDLVDSVFYGVGSSVAYGLADEHSDIDLLLILPPEEFSARESYWVRWAYENPVAEISHRRGVTMGVKVSTWDKEGFGVLFDGQGSWDDFYNGHQHFAQSLIPIHDPCDQMRAIRDSLARVPKGLAVSAAKRYSGQLEDLRCAHDMLSVNGQERFVGLLGYGIAFRALPLLFHRAGAPMPFHKWQWPLAKRLGEESRAVIECLQTMLEGQFEGIFPFPEGLIDDGVERVPSRVFALPTGVSLTPDQVEQALESVQWHLSERGEYQMVRARARGWREASLHYMCATRCLLVKGAILLETGQIACEEDVSAMWNHVHERFPGLADCIWPKASEDPFEKTLEGIDVFRQRLAGKQVIPQQYLDRPLSSPPSYELSFILEEL